MVKLFREFGDSRKGKRKTALLCGKLGKKGENQRNKECGFSFCRSSRVLAFPDNILQRVREEKWLLKNQSVRRKSVDLSPNSFFWTSKQPFALHFLLATCDVCNVAIPKIFATKDPITLCFLVSLCFPCLRLLRGDLCKSAPGHFASEKSFPSNFAQ